MALDVAVGSFAKSVASAPASQSVTITPGFVPKCLIMWMAGSVAAGSYINSYLWAMGFAVGTAAADMRSCSASSHGGQTASNASRRIAAKALTLVQWGEVTLAECDLTSFDATGFTVNWTTNTADASIIHYIALGGADLTGAKIIEWATSGSTGNNSVTGAGFQPELVLHMGGAGAASPATPSSSTNGLFSLGAMDSAGRQWMSGYASQDNQAVASNANRQQRTDRCLATIGSSGTLRSNATFVSMDADGFTVNQQAGLVDKYFSLCLAGGRHEVGAFNKSTAGAPASQEINLVGAFQPAGYALASFQNITNAANPVVHGRFGFGASDGTSEQAALIQDEDASVTTDVDAVDLTTKIFRKVDNDAATTDAEADHSTLDTDGMTAIWTTNDAVATEMLFWAFGSTAAPAGQPTYHRRVQALGRKSGYGIGGQFRAA